MSTQLYESESGVFTVTRVAAVCDDCRNAHYNAMPAPVYQFTGAHGYVTLCWLCMVRSLYVSTEGD